MTIPELDEIFSTLARVPRTDPQHAFTMPGSFYTSGELLDLEREHIFRKKWICLGREEEVANIGDYFAVDLVGEPLFVVRTPERGIKVLSNVCRHRGMPLLSGRGNTRRITCSYHAWTYDLGGQLLKAPLIGEQHSDFLSNCRLPEFQSAIWHGFIFVNLDPAAESFIESATVKALEPMIQNMHIADMRLLYSDEQEWETNWKCLVENFMESYHLSVVHSATLHAITPTRLAKHFAAGDGYFGYYSNYPDSLPSRGESHPDVTDEENRRSLMLAIAPSNVFAISGFKVTYNLIQPVSPTRVRTKIGIIGTPPVTDEQKQTTDAALELFKSAYAEDKAQLTQIMRGLKSSAYASSVLAPADYEGPIWDFYNYLADNLNR